MSHNVGKTAKRLSAIQDIATFSIFVVFTLVFAFSHKFEMVVLDTETGPVEIDIEEVDVTVHEKQQTQVQTSTVKVPLAAEDDEEIDEDVELEIEEAEFDFSDAPPPPPAAPADDDEDEAIGFFAVEQKPEKNAKTTKAMIKYIRDNYPKMARRAKVNGKVIIKFVCNREGKPVKVRVIQEKPKGMGFGEVAIGAVKQLRFKPGVQGNKPVSVNMSIPVNFKIK